MAVRNVWIFLSVSMIFLYKSDALFCFQCGDSARTGDCIVDTATMEAEHYRYNASLSDDDDDANVRDSPKKRIHNKYIKKCNEDEDTCIIEKIEEIGLLQAYIRDCFKKSDGYSLYSTRYDGLNATRNHTSCIYSAGTKRLACVTLCDSDLCNGPQIGSTASHNRIHLGLFLTFIWTWLLMYM